jgi:hypothetical protein
MSDPALVHRRANPSGSWSERNQARLCWDIAARSLEHC